MSDLFSQPELVKKTTVKKPKPKLDINYNFIEQQSKLFLEESKSNPFYDKNVYFTKKLKGNKYNQFQIIGNLGGWADDDNFSVETNYYIISDEIFKELRINQKHEIYNFFNKILNTTILIKKTPTLVQNYKYENLKIITESDFHKHILKRCEDIGDTVTKELIPN